MIICPWTFPFPDSVSFLWQSWENCEKKRCHACKAFSGAEMCLLLHCYTSYFKSEVETGHPVPDDTFASHSVEVW